ncbi:hypothetical protein P43SY_000871 [Pythium insidiosum]|uniref:Glycoside hydrolase n=1 Tax=Pythium insidiosum TaxID=114742 RepID=A0AAD5QCB4_PYTIN|nr:hypothetical protein P43SY_000871 [Pythium insidiosum]
MSAFKGANTKWTTCGRKLLVNGRSFFVRGVNYAPTPIGKPGRLDMLGHEEIFTRDLANLRGMHANAVKTYDYYSYVDHSKFLDAAYNDGKHPIFTVFSIWIDQSLMEPMTPINGPEFQKMVQSYYEMARQTSGHAGVMGYSIGGEMNSIVVIREESFWKKFELLTQAVRRGIAENNAQKIITTTFVDDGGMSFTTGEEFHADVDLWGSNVYQTNYAGSVIPTYMRVPTTNPLLVSEYGFPYASNTAEGGPEDLEMVGKMLVEQTVAMERNYNLTDSLREQILVGGFVFEYSDEWWKAGNENVHNLGEVANGGFPLGYLSEEFFGLYRAVRPEHPDAIDKLHPRPTVDLLRDVWSNGPLGGEGEFHSDCRAKPSTLQLDGRSIEARAGVLGSVVETMLAVIAMGGLVLVAFAVFTTRSRRAAYRRLSPTFKPAAVSAPLLPREASPSSRRRSVVEDAREDESLVI